MKTFETFEQVADMTPCIKRPIVVHAKKMDEEFRVNSLEGNYKQGCCDHGEEAARLFRVSSLEGNYKQGKPGDYLMRGIEGELYICDGEIFEKSYDFVKGPFYKQSQSCDSNLPHPLKPIK